MGIRATSRHEMCVSRIEEILADGPVDAALIYAKLGDEGFGTGTIYRSAVTAKVISTRKASWPPNTVWEIKNNA